MTRKIVMSMLAIFAMSTIMAQENSNVQPPVPADVAESFNMLYPNVKEVGWTFSSEFFEACFKQKEKIVSLFFDKNGDLKKVKNEIMESDLPISAKELIAKEYSGWKLEKAASIDITGTMNYETQIQKDKNEKAIVLIFDRQGILLRRIVRD